MQVDIEVGAKMLDEILWNLFEIQIDTYGVWVDAWCSFSSMM